MAPDATRCAPLGEPAASVPSDRLTAAVLLARQRRGEPVQVIDVRSPGEYAAGHIPGAVNVPREQVAARRDDLRQGWPVVLVCQNGRQARVVCALLRADLPDVLVLEGGAGAWHASGLPIVRTAATRWSLERQVRLGAGLLAMTGAILALTVDPRWALLGAFVGAGLIFAGLTDICGMGLLLAKMPWNHPRR